MECSEKIQGRRVLDGTFTARRCEGHLCITRAEDVRFTARRVCSTPTGAVMVVSPEVVWLSPGNDFKATFEVVSNVDWRVE